MADKKNRIQIILEAVDRMTGDLNKSLTDTEKRMAAFRQRTDKISGTLTSVGTMATAAGAAILGGMFMASKAAADFGDNVAKTAARFGIGVEALQEYRYAAELAGVANAEFDTAIQKLGRNTAEAAAGQGAAVKAFEALGISVTDANGSIRTIESMLPDLADRFASIEDANLKTALSMQIFGKSGAKMANLLNGGSAAMAEARQEAQRLGLVMDADAAKAAEKFSDDYTRLTKTLEAAKITIGTALMPVMEAMINRLTATVQVVRFWTAENKPLITTLGKVAGLFGVVLTVVGTLSLAAAGFLKFVNVIMSMYKAVQLLVTVFNILKIAVLTNPVLAIVAAIAAAAYLIYANWEPISAFFVELWDSVTAKFNEFVAFIKGIGSAMYEAGSNIVKSIGDGIASQWDAFIKKWEERIQTIRNYLPFSPAKEGPLRDIHRIQLVETIAERITPKPIQQAMDAAMAPAGLASGGGVPSIATAGGGGGVSVNYAPVINITGAGSDAVASFAAELQRHKSEIVRIIENATANRQRLGYA